MSAGLLLEPGVDRAEGASPPRGILEFRAPAVPVALAAAIGIIAGYCSQLPLPLWLALSLIALAGWHLAFRLERHSTAVWLLATVCFTAAGWQTLRWDTADPRQIARFATDEAAPVRLVGTLIDAPQFLPAAPQEIPAAIPQQDRTLCTLQCEMLVSGARRIPVAGIARLDVTGALPQAGAGDRIDVVGQFSLPAPRRNPGDFDFREYLRSEGMLTVVRCGEPEDVRLISQSSYNWRRWRGRVREQAEWLLRSQLSERTAPVGLGLLLGSRAGIPQDVKTAFSESGTMHILAISGANVAILASLLWVLANFAGLSRTTTVTVVLAGILGYAFLADSQPPVMRAALMGMAVLTGRPWHRQMPPINALGLAALGVFAWNPMHLFDTGAQLSFLAVAALIWAPSWLPARWYSSSRSELSPGFAQGVGRRFFRTLLVAQGTLAAIWLFTLPLTMDRFHLISPVGLFINIVLAPLVVAVLWSGYALLLLGLLVPALVGPFAWLYDAGIGLMLWMVEQAAAVPGGHFHVAGPGALLLAAYYLCLLAVGCGVRGGVLRRWGWRAMGGWLVASLAIGLAPVASGELRCTFLSVGHGLAVLVELPGGRTLLFDAGQMQNGRRASDTVQEALWSRGRSHLNALVMSHADVDHFNGVPGLARNVRIDSAFAHQSWLDFDQLSVRHCVDVLAAERIPLHLLQADDRLALDDDVSLRVLHPAGKLANASDNAHSIVLELEFAGRRILLTGDVENEGLAQLLRQPSRPIDVLLAPHHGSLRANPPALADWASPRYVIVSGGRSDSWERLRTVYGDETEVLSTHAAGAITCTISPTGELRCETFLPARRENVN